MSTDMILKQFGLVNGNYSDQANAFLSTGYTSAAGNTYFNAVRFAEGILIKEDVGEGYAHTFLNGIRIYSLKDKQLLAERDYHCNYYSKNEVETESVSMLMKVLKDAAVHEGVKLDYIKAKQKVVSIIRMAMNTDQRDILSNQSRKFLS